MVTVAAITVPRFAASGLQGLHAVGVAAGRFLLLGLVALVVSVAAVVITALAWKRLPLASRILGLAPMVVSTVAIVAVVGGVSLFSNHD